MSRTVRPGVPVARGRLSAAEPAEPAPDHVHGQGAARLAVE